MQQVVPNVAYLRHAYPFFIFFYQHYVPNGTIAILINHGANRWISHPPSSLGVY